MFAVPQTLQSPERVDYNGSRSYMLNYIQAKYNEMRGSFVLSSAAAFDL